MPTSDVAPPERRRAGDTPERRRAGDTPERRPTRQLLPRDERQASILRAAARAFAGAGYAATSMDDVAGEAGVTRLIVYRHFASKEELYRAVLDRVVERLQVEFGAGIEPTDPAGFTVRALLTVAREDPDAFRLLIVHAAREPQFRDYYEALQARAVQMADDLVGDAIPDPVTRAWITRMIVAVLHEGVLAWLEVGAAERDDEFVHRATAGLVATFVSWVSEPS